VAHASPYLDPALYDVIYTKIRADIPFYVDLAKREGGPVLEIGCGTGRVLLPTLEAGIEIHGLDLEDGMLEHLHSKAAARGFQVKAYQGDMRDFTMPARYRLATIPFRPFMHLDNTDDQLRALRCIREHLEPGGLLAFNVFYPSFDLIRGNDGVRKLAIEVVHAETGRAVRVYELSRYQHVLQRVTIDRETRVSQADGSESVVASGFTLRWTYRYEMELLLRAAGFARVDFLGGFDQRPLTQDTDEMVILARRD